ncbi:hypothetical protein GOODEAATRI_026210 [Goodea atripinnis]|uniref:Uncharacterized protein n=1 Tax=Goodea atripinnis TaxID=208336 RepID=A0ABV0NZC5_9TELE
MTAPHERTNRLSFHSVATYQSAWAVTRSSSLKFPDWQRFAQEHLSHPGLSLSARNCRPSSPKSVSQYITGSPTKP